MIGLFQRSTNAPPDLKAGRLRLVAITPEMLAAETACPAGGEELARLLAARMTPEWPPADWEPHVLRFILRQYEEHPESMGWHRYVVACDGLGLHRTLVGCVGGFAKASGEVEIGYSTLPQYQRRGYATAAARTLVEWLLAREGVMAVSAQTFVSLPESIKVMERCGMTFAGAGDDPGTVRYRRTR